MSRPGPAAMHWLHNRTEGSERHRGSSLQLFQGKYASVGGPSAERYPTASGGRVTLATIPLACCSGAKSVTFGGQEIGSAVLISSSS